MNKIPIAGADCNTPAIIIDQLRHYYPNTNPDAGLVIEHFELARGQQLFLHGDSGTGKTTLLNLLAGVLSPTSGSLTLLDQPFSSMSATKRDQFRAKHIGVVFQQFNLIPHLSVLKNIQLAAYFAGKKTRDVAQQATSLLTALRLGEDTLHRPANTLSIGQQQRVAIARALINTPQLLLIDEPTSALDSKATDAFMEVLTELSASKGISMIFVSHDHRLQRFFSQQVDLASLRNLPEDIKC